MDPGAPDRLIATAMLALCALVAACTPTSSRIADTNPLVLVPESDYDAEVARYGSVDAAFDGVETTRGDESDPDGPSIQVMSPDLTKPVVQKPLVILIEWSAHPGATVDPKTLKVIYRIGLIHKDLTGLIQEWLATAPGARLDSKSLYLPNASLPAGKHRITIELQDSLHRKSVQEIVFRIA